MNDWYNITVKHINENGGSGLLNKYGRFTFKINNVYLFNIMNGNKSNFNTKCPSELLE